MIYIFNYEHFKGRNGKGTKIQKRKVGTGGSTAARELK
jgi:hypothetical protein